MSLNCPVCTTAMQETTKNGVTIDTCPRCRGVWLDRGELEKLMAEFRDPLPPQGRAPRGYDDDDYDDDDRRKYASSSGGYPSHPHRKKSKMQTFMEIFD